MAEHFDHTMDTTSQGPTPELASPATNGTATEDAPMLVPAEHNGDGSRFALAGRKGAERVHLLIERGKLYEKEHGLKRGRQRLRQLIEEGKLYEKEHGLESGRRTRRSRLSSEQVVRRLLEALVRIARPAYRKSLREVVSALDGDVTS